MGGRLEASRVSLTQVALAEQFGVSRTPLREVLRMLQEEGFVEFEPNQRMRVAGLDPVELDADYACRIVLETLALSMTLESIGSRQRREARRLLTAMRRAARVGDLPVDLPSTSRQAPYPDETVHSFVGPGQGLAGQGSTQIWRIARIG